MSYSAKLYHYVLSFKQPFTLAGQAVNHREGVILQLTNDQGQSGWGDIAPLPGFSAEDIKQATHQLKELIKDPEAKALVAASVNFGWEAAHLDLKAQENHQSIAQELGADDWRDYPAVALLQGSIDDVLTQAENFLALNYKIFKLKVGNQNIPLDVKKVNALRELGGPNIQLRLDANRAWSLAQASLFAGHIGTDQIEFIEEPTSDLNAWPEFLQQTQMPIAADESLIGLSTDNIDQLASVRAIVLKPTLLGGVVKTLEWIAWARENGVKAIISSSFESGIGVRILAQLAQLTQQSAGLGTQHWFAQDLLPAFENEQGLINTDELLISEDRIQTDLWQVIEQ